MKWKNVAVLIIDLNHDFIMHNIPFDATRIKSKIPTIKDFLNKARNLGMHLVYVTDAHRPNDWEFTVLKPHAIDGTEGAEIIEDIKPDHNDYVVKKRRFSGFYGTDLDLYLRELGVNTVVLVGGPTHVSIRYTAVDSYQLRYRTYVLTDCTDSQTQELYESALEDMFFVKKISSKGFLKILSTKRVGRDK
jgi:nicotinamidase-related amidase